jgi:hypothetical protein
MIMCKGKDLRGPDCLRQSEVGPCGFKESRLERRSLGRQETMGLKSKGEDLSRNVEETIRPSLLRNPGKGEVITNRGHIRYKLSISEMVAKLLSHLEKH